MLHLDEGDRGESAGLGGGARRLVDSRVAGEAAKGASESSEVSAEFVAAAADRPEKCRPDRPGAVAKIRPAHR
jgi:hypothetical protein